MYTPTHIQVTGKNSEICAKINAIKELAKRNRFPHYEKVNNFINLLDFLKTFLRMWNVGDENCASIKCHKLKTFASNKEKKL